MLTTGKILEESGISTSMRPSSAPNGTLRIILQITTKAVLTVANASDLMAGKSLNSIRIITKLLLVNMGCLARNHIVHSSTVARKSEI